MAHCLYTECATAIFILILSAAGRRVGEKHCALQRVAVPQSCLCLYVPPLWRGRTTRDCIVTANDFIWDGREVIWTNARVMETDERTEDEFWLGQPALGWFSWLESWADNSNNDDDDEEEQKWKTQNSDIQSLEAWRLPRGIRRENGSILIGRRSRTCIKCELMTAPPAGAHRRGDLIRINISRLLLLALNYVTINPISKSSAGTIPPNGYD